MAATDALIMQALMAVGMSQERLEFLANAEASDRLPEHPTSAARSVRSSSQSIRSAKARLGG
jgi:hypothetical protein